MVVRWLDLVRSRLYLARLKDSARRKAQHNGWSPSAGVQRIEPFEARILLSSHPVFDSPPYAFDVSVDAQSGDLVGTVSASDPDGDMLEYSIFDGDPMGLFAIDTMSGDITVDDSFGLVEGDLHDLTVDVTDSIDTDTTTVTIR